MNRWKERIIRRLQCPRCEGDGHITMTLKDRSGRNNYGLGTMHLVVCTSCCGKGYIDQSDQDRHYNSF